ncbi:MAG: oligoribonuclease [Mariprofundaceae bacterium]
MSEPLVWMDLEMTGLDPERDTILEIATLVTDADLNVIAEGPELVIHQPDSVLEAMSPWCIEHHGASGLTARVRASRIGLREAERRTLDFVRAHVAQGASPLCGNSIHQDRRFLARWMPELEGWLHYRNIDVSTVKELVRRWYPGLAPPPKTGQHRAMADIRASVAELAWYRRHVFLPSAGAES